MDNKQVEIIHSNDIKYLIKEHLVKCEENIIILSAFVKLETLKWIEQNLHHVKSKKLLVRFRKSDLLFGATDLTIVQYCMENNWDIKFDMRLHSKVYIFDKKTFIVGSANVTDSGLSLIENANIESVASGILENKDYQKIESIFTEGISFSQELLKSMKEDLNKVDNDKKVSSNEWSKEVNFKMFESKEINLLKEDLLTSRNLKNISKHDLLLLDLNFVESHEIDLEKVKERFLASKVYNWLKVQLSKSDNGLYFGELSQLLHESIALKESVYRKDIKVYLENVITWTIQLNVAEILIDKPNYSQRLRLMS